jgi:DNA-directed RNA polymerase subunit RPC12/RpoP
MTTYRCPKCGKEADTLAARAWCNDHPRLTEMRPTNPLPLTSQEPAA